MKAAAPGRRKQGLTRLGGRSLCPASGGRTGFRAAAPGRPKRGPTPAGGRSLYPASGGRT